MTERRPIYSAQAAGQQIGYIEDDEAFDLFDRPRAIYDSNTSLLRDPKDNAVVGYVSLADIFVGPSWMAQELFSKTGPVAREQAKKSWRTGIPTRPLAGQRTAMLRTSMRSGSSRKRSRTTLQTCP